MAELRRVNGELRSVFGESYGDSKRRKEKEASAKLRSGKLRSRKSFDDQSGVEKVFKWVKENWSKPILTPEELFRMRMEEKD
jgi:hypothetical protein